MRDRQGCGSRSPRRARAAGRPEASWAQNDAARDFFTALDRANRYAILYRTQDAKKPETRARRIEKYVTMLADHKKIHP